MNKNNCLHTQLTQHALVVIPPPPERFTLNEWYLTNRMRYRTCFDQQALADRILDECDRVRDEISEVTILNKREVDHKLTEKIQDVEFSKGEIEKQRKEVMLEIDSLVTYNERIMDAMKSLSSNSLRVCRKCCILREGRLGIDLCHDDVDRELRKEIEVIDGAQKLLFRTSEQANEQVRRLRSTTYLMDRDLEDKASVLKIDNLNLSLNENSLNLSMYHGFTPLDPANITKEEWEQWTFKNIEKAAKEINSARQLRTYVDTLLKQVIEDLYNQCNIVNEAFRRRIEETKEAKTKLEIQHAEIVRQANEMTRNITRLEKSLSEKEGFMGLAHTRLGNRAQRPGVELCRDLVETTLVNEVRVLRGNCTTLQQMLAEVRLLMKQHSFLRETAPKVLKNKHNERLKLPSFKQLLYFIFAPVLIYNDFYPRKKRIRWSYVLTNVAELICIVLLLSLVTEKCVLGTFGTVGLKYFSWPEIFLKILENGFTGALFLIVGFYVVLHVVQNAFGELLKFEDRQFYQPWWTATSLSEFYRKWNILVQNWLFRYIFTDLCAQFSIKNKKAARIVTFFISAFVHEWIISLSFKLFFPIQFTQFFVLALVLDVCGLFNKNIGNLIVLHAIAFGTALQVSGYAMEYFARANCPLDNASFIEFFKLRLLSDECVK